MMPLVLVNTNNLHHLPLPSFSSTKCKKHLSSSFCCSDILPFQFENLNLQSSTATTIRMGGGPRTYPGGVSKWEWKRMQAKKAKQLLKARLCRERQLYEMRKRAELQAAVADLERPWEPVRRAPALFSVKADDQIKVLADRFQRPGGLDLWSDRDGPELFRTPGDGLPTTRFFPKGAVHSVRPYGRVMPRDVKELPTFSSIEEEGPRRGNSETSKRKEMRSSGQRPSGRKSGVRMRVNSLPSTLVNGGEEGKKSGVWDPETNKRDSPWPLLPSSSDSVIELGVENSNENGRRRGRFLNQRSRRRFIEDGGGNNSKK